MVEYPKLVGPILDAEENSQNEDNASFLFKLNRKGALGILGKKPQGAKFHELKNIDPWISLDFQNWFDQFWQQQKCETFLKFKFTLN